MNNRDIKEIQKDCKKIKRIVYSTRVGSVKEIAEKTGLTEERIKDSLEQFPKLEYKIDKLLSKRKNEGEEKKDKKKESSLKNVVTYVLDASFTGIKGFGEKLRDIFEIGSKIILTSITIKELDKLQKLSDSQGIDARFILALAAENPEQFDTILIDESLETPDDCIIKYCADNKESVILLTCDKVMALKARMYQVNTEYFKKDLRKIGYVNSKSKLSTLEVAKRKGDKLVISKFNTHNCSIKVISNNREYTEGIVELKLNDEVYVVAKKADYITFAHYVVISLFDRNNVILKYSCRIHNNKQIKKLPEIDYRRFVNEFKIRRDL